LNKITHIFSWSKQKPLIAVLHIEVATRPYVMSKISYFIVRTFDAKQGHITLKNSPLNNWREFPMAFQIDKKISFSSIPLLGVYLNTKVPLFTHENSIFELASPSVRLTDCLQFPLCGKWSYRS
jgi:hypothetical protein